MLAGKSQLAGGRPVGYLHSTAEELNLGRGGGELRTNPVSSRVEDLNPGPPNFNCSTLTTWACRLQSFNLANSVTYIYKRTTSN